VGRACDGTTIFRRRCLFYTAFIFETDFSTDNKSSEIGLRRIVKVVCGVVSGLRVPHLDACPLFYHAWVADHK